MKLILTCALIAITSTSFAAFSMADYEKAKAAKGEPVKTAPSIEPIEIDYKLGVSKNKSRIGSGESNLRQLLSDQGSAQSGLRTAQSRLSQSIVYLAREKARVKASKDKRSVSTGDPRVKAAAKVVAQCKYDLRMAKKKISGMALRIKNCRKSIASARQRVVFYQNRLDKENAEKGAAV